MDKPVAWMYDWKTPIGKNREVQHVFTSKNHLTTDLTHVLNDVENIRPLYLAPPIREPLSTKQAEDLWETTFKSAVPYYIFDEICVAIEQYHGIGVDDE